MFMKYLLWFEQSVDILLLHSVERGILGGTSIKAGRSDSITSGDKGVSSRGERPPPTTQRWPTAVGMSASVCPDSRVLIWSKCGGGQWLIQSLTGVGNSCQSHGCLHPAEDLWFRQKPTVLVSTQLFLVQLVCASPRTAYYNSVPSQTTLRSVQVLSSDIEPKGNGSITHNGH